MQEGRNFMITDEMLQEASAVVAMEMLRGISDEPHAFSVRFEKKMKRLLRRARHPVGYQVMRYAAAILLAITVLFGAVFATSPEVRAAVINWVKSAFHEFFKYSAAGTVPSDVEDVEYEYFLPDSFDGYSLLTTMDEPDGKDYVFINEQGSILQFSYVYYGNVSMFIETKHFDIHNGVVGEMPAEIYISPTGDEANVIVWQDLGKEVLFVLSAYADQHELQQLAQRVEKREMQEN